MKIDAVILAGGRIDKKLACSADVHNKAFITIGGRMMVEYPIDAVRKVKQIDRIVLVTDTGTAPDNLMEKVDLAVNGGDTIPSSLRAGVEALDPKPFRVLVLPCDLPMITPQSIEEFLEQSLNPPVDLTYAYLSRKNSEAKYPDIHHTYARLKEGVFCGTGLFCINPYVVKNCEQFFNELSKNRKNLIALASLLGFGKIVKYVLGILSIKEIEGRLLEIMGCSGRGMETTFAEAGFNVDVPEDLEIARRILDDKYFSDL